MQIKSPDAEFRLPDGSCRLPDGGCRLPACARKPLAGDEKTENEKQNNNISRNQKSATAADQQKREKQGPAVK